MATTVPAAQPAAYPRDDAVPTCTQQIAGHLEAPLALLRARRLDVGGRASAGVRPAAQAGAPVAGTVRRRHGNRAAVPGDLGDRAARRLPQSGAGLLRG